MWFFTPVANPSAPRCPNRLLALPVKELITRTHPLLLIHLPPLRIYIQSRIKLIRIGFYTAFYAIFHPFVLGFFAHSEGKLTVM
jgi:hypothetical protein